MAFLRTLLYQIKSESSYNPTFYTNVLFVLVASYIVKVLVPEVVSPEMWLTAYWLVVFLAITTSFMMSFDFELKRGHFFVYQLMSPEQLLASKMIFNAFKAMVLHLMVLVVMMLFFESSFLVLGWKLFLLLGVSSVCLSVTLTFVAALSQRVQRNAALYSVMGLPLLMSVVWLMSGYSQRILLLDGSVANFFQLTVAYIILIGASAFWLFGYIWKE